MLRSYVTRERVNERVTPHVPILRYVFLSSITQKKLHKSKINAIRQRANDNGNRKDKSTTHLVRVVIAGYFRSINVFHTGVTIDQRTSTYVNRAVDKFRLDVVRASNKLRVLSDPTRPTRSAILENRRMRNLPLRYLHIHTTMFASSAQLSTASLSLCPSI